MGKWTAAQMPGLAGMVAVVTGASSGIGAAAAEALAGKGAHVVLAVRNGARGAATRAAIVARHPAAHVSVEIVDVADLASIRRCAAHLDATLPQVDILINNAGLGMQPRRAVTVDGFERQFGTNHLGAFALTGLLMPALLRAPAPRVVAVASNAHRRTRMRFDDLHGERDFWGVRNYGQSKLANLMFAFELDRRARAAGSRLVSVAAHPGLADTAFFDKPGAFSPMTSLAKLATRVAGQNAAAGALPVLYAATMADVDGGDYWGPDGFLELAGAPARAHVAAHARDARAQRRLWDVSAQLTGVAVAV